MDNNSGNGELENMAVFGCVSIAVFSFISKIEWAKIGTAIGAYLAGLGSSFINFMEPLVILAVKGVLLAGAVFVGFKILEFIYQMTWAKISTNRSLCDDLHTRLSNVETSFKKFKHHQGYRSNSLEEELSELKDLCLKLKDFSGLTAEEEAQKALKAMSEGES